MSTQAAAIETRSTSPEAAVPTDHTVSLLRMAVGNETLAISIRDVREILQVGRLTPMPRTPDFVRGVMNLRGVVVPVIDLAARLGRAPAELTRRSCIVVVEVKDDEGEGRPMVAGLLVDAVSEVFDRDASAIETAPEIGTRVPVHFLRGITRADGRLVGVLSLSTVLSVAELSAGIESHHTH